jgi:phosphoribosyl 1,2-cyclic phosphate phosphodiesterase
MKLKVTILGCGNSAGVPAIGNYWGACDPNEPRNRRTRPSIAVQTDKTTIIVDTGNDFKEQMNREDIRHIDAVLYTHAHGDHTAGTDDLRVLRIRSKKFVDIYADKPTMDDLRLRFDYIFTEKAPVYPQIVEPHLIEPSQFGKPMTIGDITLVPFEQEHGTCKSLGYRFGNLAYSTDMVTLDDAAIDALRGIDTWIADAAAYKMEKNMVHITLKQLMDLNDNHVKAKKVWLTHLPPSMDYRTLLKELPPGYEPAFDGMVLEAQI